MFAWKIAVVSIACCFPFAISLSPRTSSDNPLDSAVHQFGEQECHPSCRFELCSIEKRLILGKKELNPQAICRKGGKIGRILKIGKKIILRPEDYASEKKLRAGLLKIVPLPFGTRASGVMTSVGGRGLVRSNGDGLPCLKVPILEYEKITKKGIRVVRTKDPRDCLSFSSFTPYLVAELEWDSADDLDVRVGTRGYGAVSESKNKYFYNQCDSGLLSSPGEVCGNSTKSGFDRLFIHTGCNDFDFDLQYTLSVRHKKNCGQGPTNWKLNLFANGRPFQNLSLSGTSDSESKTVIAKTRFVL